MMKLADFQLADEEEREALDARIRRFNQTATAFPREKSIPELFTAWANETPDAVAVSGAAVYSYREVEERSNQIARWLLAQGVGAGSFVTVLVDRSALVGPALLGILKAGAACLPINPSTPLERMQYMFADCGSAWLIGDFASAEKCRLLAATQGNGKVLFLDDAPLAGSAGAEANSSALARLEAAPLPAPCTANSLAYVIYTSGSTGRPKGVLIEHRAVVRLVCRTNYMQLGPADRILQTASLAFDASLFEVWGALLNGGRLCIAAPHDFLDPAALGPILAENGITTLFLTTSLFNTVVECSPAAFTGLKTVLTGAEKVSPRHINQFLDAHPQVRLLHVYGPTENTTYTTFHHVRAKRDDDVPIGTPVANTTVYVLDEEMAPVEPGTAGELYTGGAGLARAYLNDASLTAERFLPSPFGVGERLYRTGDRVRWSHDDDLEFLGRFDDQVKIRGYRIELGEIEARLRQHRSVRQCVVTTWESDESGRRLAAYFTADSAVDLAALRRELEATLPDYMVPTFLEQLEKLPLNGSGKVDRRALPHPRAPTKTQAVETGETELPTHTMLRELWEELLHVRPIQMDDNFFTLGGHSLTAAKLASQIHKRVGLVVPLTTVFNVPTIRMMGDFLLECARFGVEEIDDSMARLHEDPEQPLVFAFPPGTADALGYGQLATLLRPYAFHAFNFIETENRLERYADLIEQTAGERPFVLFGYSGGGNLAFRVANEMERRGRPVSDLVLLDAAAFPAPCPLVRAEARKLAEQFLASDEAKIHLSSIVLRDKALRNIERYHDCLSRAADEGVISGNIHLLVSEDSPEVHYDSGGKIICSTRRWAELTGGEFLRYQASGGHNNLLYEPHLHANARLLRGILDAAFATRLVMKL